jgi:hypothetical protein
MIVNGPPHTGRNVIVVLVLLLAVILPITIALTIFQDAPSSTDDLQIQATTTSATPVAAVDTPRPAQPTKTVRKAEPAQANNCTYPADHWLASTQNWPAEITIGNLYYTQEQAIEFITAQPSDVFNVLFIQLHAAYLNILSGASQSQIVEPILQASEWLHQMLSGSDTAKHEQEWALELARHIQAYNSGETGPGRCAAYTPPKSYFNDKISAAVLSLTPDIRIEAAQTNSADIQTPTWMMYTPASGLPDLLSTATRTPTSRPNPGATSVPTTLAPTVRPSATQVPPTDRPTSPPPTDRPTSLPPTDHPTSPPPTDHPTSPPPTATPRPAEPTPTTAPPEESTPTSPPI